MILTTINDLIQLLTSGTSTVKVHATWVDDSSGVFTAGRLNTSTSAAGPTTIVSSPSSSVQRKVKFISVYNSDPSVSTTITVQHTDGTTVVPTETFTLPAGWIATYVDLLGWITTDAGGGRIETPLTGRFLKSNFLTSSSGNLVTGPSTNSLKIRGVAGGGAGGGCTSVASDSAAAGGGGSGSYVEWVVAVTPNSSYAYTCGAGGTGVSANAGNGGGNSTFIVGATTVTCNGGGGAPVGTNVATLVVYPGGAGGAVSTNGTVNCTGQPGEQGTVVVVDTATGGCSGSGGDSPFGGGGLGTKTDGNGANAAGYGGGGSGACNIGANARTGGNGAPGCWVVDEYS